MAKNTNANFFDITSDFSELSEKCKNHSTINTELYAKYDVKRGLRDINGNGVLTGLTEISEIVSSKNVDGTNVSCEGKLFYRGIDVENLVDGFISEKRFGYEETVYLLLFGELPTQNQLEDFNNLIIKCRTLPRNFVRDIIMKAPTAEMMNTLSRSVLTLYAYDKKANDMSLPNVLRQCLQMIALFPQLAVYGYQAHVFNSHTQNSLVIHSPHPDLSIAENILYMLRPDHQFSKLEAELLDLSLILHAEHGGGNNSTFTTHVVASSGTDAYSVIAAALGSLKGPRHGGANIKVVEMFKDMKKNVTDWKDEDEIKVYLKALLNKEAFDKSGLIYGMGHAVYSLSDPRANVLKKFVKQLSEEKGRQKEYGLYEMVERLAPIVIGEERKTYKGVSANVDFYSGFVYHMLGLPGELYTPIFAISRISGWCAHMLEEQINVGKIIRPAYKSISDRRDYIPLTDR